MRINAIKTKIKTYGKKINTDSNDMPMPQENSYCICCFFILIEWKKSISLTNS